MLSSTQIFRAWIYSTNLARIKISVNTDISVIGFYGNIGNIENIGKISVDIFTKILVINFFFIF